MSENELIEKLDRHETEMNDYIDVHSGDFNTVLSSTITEIFDSKCMLIIAGQNFVDITFDPTNVIQIVLEQAHQNFSQKQNFTDRDGEDFGHVTVWLTPNITIQSNVGTHPIRKLVILEYLEEGHEVNNIIKILI